jgi:hypothetical protein
MHRIYTFIIHEMLSAAILPESNDTLHEDLYEAKSRHVVYSEAVHTVAGILESAGCEYILLKGSSLWSYYPEEFLRDQEDIDILVKPEDRTHTIELLVKEGFKNPSADTHSFHISLTHTSSDIPDVEIHNAVSPPGKNWINSEALFLNKASLVLGGRTIPVLDFKHTLLCALTHAANHHIISRLQWLNDIRFLVDSGGDYAFVKELKGVFKRSASAVLHYTGLVFPSSLISELADSIPVSSLFKVLCRKVIPESEFLENPVSTSPLRKALYNVALIQNPINIGRAFLAGKQA